MTRVPRWLLLVIMIGMLLVLAACGGASSPAVEQSEPAAESPTRTPRPTREAAEQPADPVPPTGSSNVLEVQMGRLQTYEHPSGVFEISVPENWSLQDSSRPDELILVWTDPTRNGAVIVDIFESAVNYSDDELIDILANFLDTQFSDEREYVLGEPVVQGDDSILLIWSYLARADNNADVMLLGNSFIEQRGDKVSILTTLIPDEQFDLLVDGTDEIINSYRINPRAALAGTSNGSVAPSDGQTAIEFGRLRTYEHPSGIFQIDIPENWSLEDMSLANRLLLFWSDPTGDAGVFVDIQEDASTYSEDELVVLLEEFLEGSFSAATDFGMDEPRFQSDDSILIVWSYTPDNSESRLLGNSFIEQRGDKLSILSTLVPEDEFDLLVEYTDEIINTYLIDAEASW
ncbi:hypothetical protein [Candidatus Viridilinea mediisalina]|uniref:DUF1795 domain-containing protein n=1 Tax=Candidatus Viridilinea mediisalina TaxID=2024553 RepID=A0A2A6RNC5_9CHLR|nr:hypothetical protein [Candidatus Viridilinea mediisalina]PDW04594.1 hypothetical protein CJ255_02775 [Candidatus Viridilinea mediisalina]